MNQMVSATLSHITLSKLIVIRFFNIRLGLRSCPFRHVSVKKIWINVSTSSHDKVNRSSFVIFILIQYHEHNGQFSRYSDWATGWMVQDRVPVETRVSTRPDRPGGPPSFLYNGYRVFPGAKVRPGRAADHSPPPNAAVTEEYSYTSTHTLGHIGPVTGSFYL
jgi:hypothetical protein